MSTPTKVGYLGPSLPTRYAGLSPAMRRLIRAEYAQRQEGKCLHCAWPLEGPPSAEVRAKPINWNLFPPNFTKWPLHLHHDHRTGLTIGTVHAYCNAVMWQYHGE
jgi:hypothetical protein